MTFGERLAQLRKENGFNTRNEFAETLGIPSTTLRNYETNVREPGHTFLKQVSELFNVSVDYLLCLTDDKEVLNTFRLRSSEQDMIEKYRLLDSYGQETVKIVLDREINRAKQFKRLNAYCEALNNMSDNRHPLPSRVAEVRAPYEANAAHERTDIQPTPEGQDHDDAIMNNDSEWE